MERKKCCTKRMFDWRLFPGWVIRKWHIIGGKIIGTGWRDQEKLGRGVQKIFSLNILILEVYKR